MRRFLLTFMRCPHIFSPLIEKRPQNPKYFRVYRPLVLTVSIALLASLFAALPVVRTEATVPTLSNATTYQSEIKTLFQTAYDSLGGAVDFAVIGNDLCKNFLISDTAGNVVLFKNDATGQDEFRTAPLAQALPDEQLMAMGPANDNAYNRMGLAGYQVQCSVAYTMQNGIVNVNRIDFHYILTWRDGASALAAKNAVVSHARAYLDSADYPGTGTEYERLRAINRYICRIFQYDYRLFVPAEAASTLYTAFGMISDSGAIGGYKRGVCQAYAMYGYLMLKQAGFDTIIIDGNAGGGGHAWNMVRTGSQWYHIDFTWDDPVSDGNPAPYTLRQSGAGLIEETYLLRIDSEISINHGWTPTQNGYTYPRTPTVKHPNTAAMPGNIPTQFNPVSTLTTAPTKVPAKPTPTKTASANPTSGGSSNPGSKDSSLASVQIATIENSTNDSSQSISPGEQPKESDIPTMLGISRFTWLKGIAVAVVILVVLLLIAIRRNRRYQ